MTTLPVVPTGVIPRGPCKLSREERDVILPYKEQYRDCITKEERHAVYRGHIGPALFEYWRVHHLHPAEGAESNARTKVWDLIFGIPITLISFQAIAEWLTNNWRPKITTARGHTGQLKVSYLSIVIRRHNDKLVKWAQEEFQVGEFSWSEMPYFGQRTRIGKQVFEQILTEAEREEVRKELKRVREEGWDEVEQQRYVLH